MKLKIVLSQAKKWLNTKGLLMYWQYLVIAMPLSFYAAFEWAFQSISASSGFEAIIVFFAILQGFLAFFYMQEKGEPRMILYSLLFSLGAYYLGKYLLFVHYYDWVIAGVVDKDQLDFSLLFFYFKTMDMGSMEDFFRFYKSSFGVYEAIILILLTLPTGTYFLLWKNDLDLDASDEKQSRRRIQRRFTGQHH